MLGLAIPLLLVTLLSSCATTTMAPAAAVSDLAPTGRLRAAINFGNPMLASRDASSGEARGALFGAHSAVVGSITEATSETRFAGKPPCWACSRTIFSFGAMYTQ